MDHATRRITCLLFLLISLPLTLAAQLDENNVRREVWPEVDVYVPLKEKLRLFFLFTISKAEETRNNLEGQFGAHLDYTVSKKLILRAGYRYGFSLTEEDPFTEHRIVTEQTLRQPLPLEILLSDRNREDFRFVNGQFSFRYRNRVTLEREFVLSHRSVTPYVAGEAFHDSRFDVWNRNRLTAGVQIQVKKALPLLSMVVPRKQLVLDLYYTKQNDSRSQPNHVRAIGAALNIHF